MSHLTPDQVLVTPAGELAELSSESLFKVCKYLTQTKTPRRSGGARSGRF